MISRRLAISSSMSAIAWRIVLWPDAARGSGSFHSKRIGGSAAT